MDSADASSSGSSDGDDDGLAYLSSYPDLLNSSAFLDFFRGINSHPVLFENQVGFNWDVKQHRVDLHLQFSFGPPAPGVLLPHVLSQMRSQETDAFSPSESDYAYVDPSDPSYAPEDTSSFWDAADTTENPSAYLTLTLSLPRTPDLFPLGRLRSRNFQCRGGEDYANVGEHVLRRVQKLCWEIWYGLALLPTTRVGDVITVTGGVLGLIRSEYVVGGGDAVETEEAEGTSVDNTEELLDAEESSNERLNSLHVSKKKPRTRTKKKKKRRRKGNSSTSSNIVILSERERWTPESTSSSDSETKTSDPNYDLLNVLKHTLAVTQCNKIEVSEMINPSTSMSNRFTVRLLKSNSPKYFEKYAELYEEMKDDGTLDVNRLSTNQIRSVMEVAVEGIGIKKYRSETLSIHDVEGLLRRSKAAVAVDGSTLFIHGGMDSNRRTLSDLIRISPDRVDVYRTFGGFGEDSYSDATYASARTRAVQESYLAIPPMAGHKMIPMFGGLLIFGSSSMNRAPHQSNYDFEVGNQGHYAARFYQHGSRSRLKRPTEMMFYFIRDIHKRNIRLGVQAEVENRTLFRHPCRRGEASDVDSIPTLEDFSLNEVETRPEDSVYYLFGGRHVLLRGQASQSLYSITWVGGRRLTIDKLQRRSRGGVLQHWPCARFGHGAVAIRANLYVYGGACVDGRFLNDLHCFNSSSRIWTEFQLDLLPPPMCSFGIYSNGTVGFSIVGGKKKDKSPGKDPGATVTSSEIFTYRFKQNDFVVSNVMTNSDPDRLRLEGINIVSMDVGSNSLGQIVVGGHCDLKGASGGILRIENPTDIGASSALLHYLEESRQNRIFTDVIFRLIQSNENEEEEAEGEGERVAAEVERIEIPAHQCILACRCPELADYAAQNGILLEEEDHEAHQVEHLAFGRRLRHDTLIVDLFEENSDAFVAFLHFLYTGEIETILSRPKVINFLTCVERWSPTKHYPFLRSFASRQSPHYLDVAASVMRQLESDFQHLLHDNPLHSDLSLVFADGSIHQVHKLFVVRSPYFRNMLSSSFREATESEIDFSQFDKDCITDILSYLYTDRLEMNPSNCVGVLLLVHQFEIPAIANFCRRLVQDYMDEDNVVPLLRIAELYRDMVLFRMCESFVVKHYDVVSNDPIYVSEVDPTTRLDIKKKADRRMAREEKKRRKRGRQ